MAAATRHPEDLSDAWRMVKVLQKFSSAQRALLEKYDIDIDRPGEYNSDGYQPADSLATVAMKHGVDVVEVIEHIKKSQGIAQELEVTVRETSELVNEGKVALLDVREPRAFAVASIPGSRRVDEALAEEIVQSWSKDTPIVLICHHGVRTSDAAEYLREYGFANVKSLSGGIDAWSLEIDPSVPRY